MNSELRRGSMDRFFDVRELAPIHEVEQGFAVEQIDPRLLRGLPALKLKLVRFRGEIRQGASKQVVRDCLQSPALLGGFLFQLTKELIINSQRDSTHMQNLSEENQHAKASEGGWWANLT